MDKFTSIKYISSEFHIWFGSQLADMNQQVNPVIIHGASGGKIENMFIPRALQWNHFKPLQKKNTEDDNLKK